MNGDVWNQLDAQARADLQPRADQIGELFVDRHTARFDDLVEEVSHAILETHSTLYDWRVTWTGPPSSAPIDNMKGRERVDRRARDDAGAGFGPLQVRCCLEPHLADGVVMQGLRVTSNQMESDVAAPWAGCSAGCRPDPEDRHAARREACNGFGWPSSCRVLSRMRSRSSKRSPGCRTTCSHCCPKV